MGVERLDFQTDLNKAALEKQPVVPKDPPQVTVTVPPPDSDTETTGADLPESAYQKALVSFSDDERAKLTKQETITILFQQLNESDQGHHERSLLRRGLKRVKPHLERLNATIDFISPFASMQPAAGTALGLVKGSASALVNVYKDLLQFYLKTLVLFEESRFVLGVALEILKPKIVDIVSSFKSHMDILSPLLETETFAAVQELKDGQLDALICSLFPNGESESDYYNSLEQRANDACRWLTSNNAYSYWFLNCDTNVLALFGDMGSGKTMTTAFVVESLTDLERPLCAYYCKDEYELVKLRNIYRSILFQFLQQSEEWYQAESKAMRGGVNPTQSDDKLRKFIFQIVLPSRKPVFLVLDALDECAAYSQREILALFRELFERKAPLKVFLSSRYNEAIEAGLPPGATRIELRPSRDRDFTIATYLVARTSLPTTLHPKAVEELAARSHGSAIWLRIAVEYIDSSQSASPKGLEMALARLPSSKGLADLYGKLFDKVCRHIPENKARLQIALEILAVARRPLTLEELSYAVYVNDEGFATLAQLDELAHSCNLLSFIRPFVTATSKGRDMKSSRLRLVHQSLKELILIAPPSA
ncbi:hypothetical protein N0V88_003045 [Collariella sp. IMI 366227]|nr:hypothetical protein N0V88_003045 [Collariella sp. IMI 366227]